MKFEVGDKIILSEDQVLFLIKIHSLNRISAESVMEIKEIGSNNFYVIEVVPKNKVILSFESKDFRLATEYEIKRNKIKKLFIDKKNI